MRVLQQLNHLLDVLNQHELSLQWILEELYAGENAEGILPSKIIAE